MPEAVKKCVEETGGIEGLESMLPRTRMLKSKANIFHALSDETRLKVISILARIPSCVCVIKEIVKIADSKLSYHLGLLKDAGLIGRKREKNWIIYSLTETGRRIAEDFDL
ncbi:MAG: ArsR/SmtB family transcription factor [Thermoplasmata archaeon]